MPYKDKEKQRKFQSKWRRQKNRRTRDRLWKYKDGPCVDCGHKYPPWVMDFDHVRGKKSGALSKIALNSTIEQTLTEIAKCELVCANCHRERTHKRRVA